MWRRGPVAPQRVMALTCYRLQMQDSDESAFTLVYEGYDPLQAGMLARLLEAEGIVCRHLGSQHPAALGIGEFACEQRLEVPASEAARSRELIAEALGSPVADDGIPGSSDAP